MFYSCSKDAPLPRAIMSTRGRYRKKKEKKSAWLAVTATPLLGDSPCCPPLGHGGTDKRYCIFAAEYSYKSALLQGANRHFAGFWRAQKDLAAGGATL